jgi:hypothetical protein
MLCFLVFVWVLLLCLFITVSIYSGNFICGNSLRPELKVEDLERICRISIKKVVDTIDSRSF